MSRFARNCLEKSIEVFHHLEVTLGPGTSALNLRLGLHSGPVTAGMFHYAVFSCALIWDNDSYLILQPFRNYSVFQGCFVEKK